MNCLAVLRRLEAWRGKDMVESRKVIENVRGKWLRRQVGRGMLCSSMEHQRNARNASSDQLVARSGSTQELVNVDGWGTVRAANKQLVPASHQPKSDLWTCLGSAAVPKEDRRRSRALPASCAEESLEKVWDGVSSDSQQPPVRRSGKSFGVKYRSGRPAMLRIRPLPLLLQS